MKQTFLIATSALALSLWGEGFKMNRAVMSPKYWSIWNDRVQAQIDANIEKFRKADIAVQLKDVPAGTEVKVEQLTHAFFFGAHIFNYNQLGKKEWNDRYKALYDAQKGLFNSGTVAFYWRTLEKYPYAPRFAERYEDTENFWNTCPQPKDQDHWRRPAPDPVIAHLKTGRCRIHGHPLVWGNNAWHTPTWLWDDFTPESEKRALEQATGVTLPQRDTTHGMGLKNMKGDAAERLWSAAWQRIYAQLSEQEIAALVPTFVKNQKLFYEKRIREIGERYGSRVDSWDVVNESATDWAIGAKRTWPAGESAAVNTLPITKSHYGLMPANYAFMAIVLSRKYMKPDAWLNVNEYNMEAFPGQIADLAAHGAKFDVVGAQMHLFNPAESVKIAAGEYSSASVKKKIDPAEIVQTFAEVAAKAGGRPIHLSEITITAPDMSANGQMVQAIILHNLYRAWFAVEQMNGVTWWNVVDDCGAPGEPSISGLFTRDMRPKTAYFAMNDLINRAWKTRLTVKTTEQGHLRFRGFKGTYRLSWRGSDGKEKVQFVSGGM